MIRITEMEVCNMERENIDSGVLMSFFKEAENRKKIVAIYEGGNFFATVNYDDFVIDNNITNCTLNSKYNYFINDEGIFENISNIFQKSNNKYLPVMDENDKILYLAENIQGISYELNTSINSIELGGSSVTLRELYPELGGVCLYGFNEWSLRFLRILKKWGIGFEVRGEKWNVFFPKYASNKLNLPENKIVNIYTDGLSCFPEWKLESFEREWSFLLKIATENYIHTSETYYRLFQTKGICCLRAFFPINFHSISLQEEYRRLAGISGVGAIGKLGKYADEQINQVNGSIVTRNELNEYMRKECKYFYIDGHAIKMKHWGEEQGSYKLYLIGPCIVEGITIMRDSENLGACLYHNIKKQGLPYTVVGIVVNSFEFYLYEKILRYLTIEEGDIILLISNQSGCTTYHSDIDIKKIIEKRTCDWFYNVPIHTNYTGNVALARAIVDDYLISFMKQNKNTEASGRKVLQVGERELDESEMAQINAYIRQIKNNFPIGEGEKGAIVMNCNPMTKGHEWLILEALKTVDFLYVFVVEEDKSEIAFKDRMAMVKRACNKMKNVIVIPSGRFILSAMTLPLYFEKARKQDMVLDASVDLQIFGECIAKGLGITKRFVGTEKTDLITKQYNEQMKKRLPPMGVSLVEIQRLRYKDEDISASIVRKAMKECDYEKIMHYVPIEVFDYLKLMEKEIEACK